MDGINEFLDYLQNEKRYADHTIISYRNDLEQFHVFCLEEGNEDMDLHFKTIRNWIVFMMDKGYQPRTIHRKLSSLRSYCKFLIRMGSLDHDPVEKILKPKLKKRIPQFIDDKSINEFLDYYDFGDDYSGIRNRLIINLLYQTGIRRAELQGLKIDSVDYYEHLIKVLGKRKKERLIPIGKELIRQLEEYMEIRRITFNNTSETSLFLTDRGSPIYAKLIYRIVTRHIGMFSTLEKISPHLLRHTFATHMLNRGADLNAIKELLGHANLSATEVYTHNTFEKLKSIYNQAHPRA